MAKAKKAMLQEKQGNNKAKIEMTKAERNKLLDVGSHIVEVELQSHDTTRAALLACIGKSPAQMEVVIAGYETAWKQHAEGITARGSHSTKALVSMSQRSIWNRVSDGKAVLRAIGKLNDMSKAERQEVTKIMESIGGYHALVAYCRKVNKGQRKAPESSTAEERAKKAWSNKPTEMVKTIEGNLKFATLQGLILLQDWISDRIAKLKAKQPKASVTKLSDKRKAKAKGKLAKAVRKAA